MSRSLEALRLERAALVHDAVALPTWGDRASELADPFRMRDWGTSPLDAQPPGAMPSPGTLASRRHDEPQWLSDLDALVQNIEHGRLGHPPSHPSDHALPCSVPPSRRGPAAFGSLVQSSMPRSTQTSAFPTSQDMTGDLVTLAPAAVPSRSGDAALQLSPWSTRAGPKPTSGTPASAVAATAAQGQRDGNSETRGRVTVPVWVLILCVALLAFLVAALVWVGSAWRASPPTPDASELPMGDAAVDHPWGRMGDARFPTVTTDPADVEGSAHEATTTPRSLRATSQPADSVPWDSATKRRLLEQAMAAPYG